MVLYNGMVLYNVVRKFAKLASLEPVVGFTLMSLNRRSKVTAYEIYVIFALYEQFNREIDLTFFHLSQIPKSWTMGTSCGRGGMDLI